MLYSKLFGKTVREETKDITFLSHKLLFKGGFIRESTAGRYFLLPLGMRVHDKITNIIEEEMNKAGAQKMISPTLHPLELWEETNRIDASNFELMTIEDRRGAKFALGGTAEEMFVDVVRKFRLSYKDLPFNIYQFSTKFRDEMRARGGLLRLREFVMKDAYSFHTTNEDFDREYNNMAETYSRIYQRVGLDAKMVLADNGYFGGDYCHEFVVDTEIGETKYLVAEDGSYIAHEDVAVFDRGNINLEEKEKEFEINEQPEWVKTMDDNVKHYAQPKWRFLKNVVYKNRVTNEIIIAVLRGDLEVNKNKLENALEMIGLLDDATEADLTELGTKSGWVHSWGHKAKYIGDISLKSVKNLIGGHKEPTTDSFNVNYGRDFECELIADIALAKEGHLSEKGAKLIEKRGVEVGNIFQLGQHYSRRMRNATFVDNDGKEKPFYMGCYGLGIGRTLATVVEVKNDERGIIWPVSIAPYKIHLVGLDLKDENIKNRAFELYQYLTEKGLEVLFDDREDVSAGEKFGDADLIGNPWRVVISKRTGDQIEVRKRDEKESKLMNLSELIELIS